MFVSGNKRKKEVDVNHFDIFLTHAHLGVLKATAQQHRIRLVGKLAPVFRVFVSEGYLRSHFTPHDGTGVGADGTD